MTAPTPKIELLLGGSWVDITSTAGGLKSFVRLPEGIICRRGRNNEQDDPEPGTLTFTVDNSDGRFTIGRTSGPYGANFVLWTKVRYTVNGVLQFTGYMLAAPATWNYSTRALSDVTITAVDVLQPLADSPVVRSWADALIGALSPTYWWKMNDPEGATSAAPSAGGVPLVGTWSPYTTATAITESLKFATAAPEGTDSDTQLQIDTVDLVEGGGATGHARLTATLTIPTTFTMLFLYSGAPGTYVFQIGGTGLTLTVISSTSLMLRCGAAPAVYFSVPASTQTLIGISVTPSTVTVLGTGVTTSGAGMTTGAQTFNWFPAGAAGQLAFIPSALSEAAFASLKAKLVGDGMGLALDFLSRAVAEAGYPASVLATYNRPIKRPILKGSNPAEIGNTIARACAGMFVANRNGDPLLIDFTYCPARVDIDSGDFIDGITWDADSSLWYTDIIVDDVVVGTTGGFPRRGRTVPNILSASDLASLVSYLINTADIWLAPRISSIKVNLWPMDATKTAKYLGLDLKSRIYPLNLPNTLPTPMILTVEGYESRLDDKAWTLALFTAPDPSFVMEDDIAGIVESNYRLGPF